MWGRYCCKSSKENDANDNDAGLTGRDGSTPMSLGSACCENNNYIPCDNIRGCTDNRGNILPL